MARPRRTDADKGLNRAMALFWRKGFHQTGTREIEDETGITRFLLQREHGGKKALFLRTLDHYLDVFEQIGAPPKEPKSVSALADWFKSPTDDPNINSLASNGCFLLASLSELGAGDQEIAMRSRRFFKFMRTRFGASLAHLQQLGKLNTALAAGDCVEILLALSISQNAQIRAARDRGAGQVVANAAGALLHNWAVRDTAK